MKNMWDVIIVNCPHCNAIDQNGQYCTRCGAQIQESAEEIHHEERRYFGRFSAQQMIAFLTGFAMMLLIALIIFAVMGRETYTIGEGQTVMVNKGQEPEDGETVALRSATVEESTQPEDAVTGHWMHYTQGIKVDKIGNRRYRFMLENQPYEMLYNGTQYVINKDEVRYYFVINNNDKLILNGADRPSGLAVENPLFAADFLAGRVSSDGRPVMQMEVNPDAFSIIGYTYGQLAGRFGPGAVTVINDEQFIVFRGNGGNFAVSFSGESVPLAAEPEKKYRLTPLTNTPEQPTPPETSTTPEPPNPGTDDDEATPADKNKPKEPELETDTPPKVPETRDFTYRVEVPDMPTFPSNGAVASGVVWADLGFVVQNMPQQITLTELSGALGVNFETGGGSEWVNGYQFYGGTSGYFAATYQYGNGRYKLSGYGREQLDKDKTILFIEKIG